MQYSKTTHQGRPHLEIRASGAVFRYDTAAGGFSSIIDADNNDWIAFHTHPTGVPAGAAGVFRGLPNLAHRQDPAFDGTGHPGFDRCESTIDGNRITARAADAWELAYTFDSSHVRLDVSKTQPGKNYWFLYEGPPGGRYDAADTSGNIWGTDVLGQRTDAPQPPERGTWPWMYFGHRDVPRVFFVMQLDEPVADQFYYMDAGVDNDGMAVFGFGRRGIESLLSGPRSFLFGFIESTDHERIRAELNELQKM